MSSFVLNRVWSNEHATLGNLYAADDKGIRMIAFTLEDPHQTHKIAGRTRIPEGEYRMKRRTVGKWATRFQKLRYPGSIELCDVPEFTDVLIHYGNTDEDTAGCVLLGEGCTMDYGSTGEPFLSSSKNACKTFYDIFYAKPDSYSWRFYIRNYEYRCN